jgi:hypothetical protein
MKFYEAATGPGHLLKRSGVSGKTLAEKRKSAVEILSLKVNAVLRRDC